MTKTKLIGGLVAVTALLSPLASAAQDGAFDPLGIRAGAFLIYPSLRATGTYDDNIFATRTNETDDFIFTLRPELRAESQWSRHQLTASAFGEFAFFADEDDSNYEDFGAALAGRLDITREARTTGRLAFARLNEGRAEPDEAGQAEVTQYWQYDATLAHRQNLARFFVQPSASIRRLSFEEAGNVSNAGRDRNRYGLGLRAGFVFSPAINLFGEVNGDIVEYDSDAVDRDSTGVDARVGAEFEITRIALGEASIGFARRNYDSSARDNVTGVVAAAGVTWFPTQLTTVNLFADAGIRETTVIFQGEQASGNRAVSIGADVAHELRRNIILRANARYDRDDFQGTSRTDDTFNVGGGAAYLLNRNLSVDASYNYSNRSSDANFAKFSRNIVRIGVTARL